jgi:hypothetical protein
MHVLRHTHASHLAMKATPMGSSPPSLGHEAIAEFSRFYEERRGHEVEATPYRAGLWTARAMEGPTRLQPARPL